MDPIERSIPNARAVNHRHVLKDNDNENSCSRSHPRLNRRVAGQSSAQSVRRSMPPQVPKAIQVPRRVHAVPRRARYRDAGLCLRGRRLGVPTGRRSGRRPRCSTAEAEQILTHFLSPTPYSLLPNPTWQHSHDSSIVWGQMVRSSSDPQVRDARRDSVAVARGGGRRGRPHRRRQAARDTIHSAREHRGRECALDGLRKPPGRCEEGTGALRSGLLLFQGEAVQRSERLMAHPDDVEMPPAIVSRRRQPPIVNGSLSATISTFYMAVLADRRRSPLA